MEEKSNPIYGNCLYLQGTSVAVIPYRRSVVLGRVSSHVCVTSRKQRTKGKNVSNSSNIICTLKGKKNTQF